MMRTWVIAIAALGSLALPGSAMAASSTATGRGVTATVSWSGTLPTQTGLTLRISDNGSVVLHRPITSRYCAKDCNVASYGTHPPIHVVSLGGSSTPPSVVLSLYTGGAHCCEVAQVYSPTAAGRWTLSEHNFADPGYKIATVGSGAGRAKVFVTEDDAFAYAFTDFADSAMPVQLLSLHSGRFVDVTSRYRSIVKADAARLLTAYKETAPKYSDTVGILAAWTADEARLGDASQAFEYLDQQASLHRVNAGPFPVTKGGTAFVATLRTFLAKHGYLARAS